LSNFPRYETKGESNTHFYQNSSNITFKGLRKSFFYYFYISAVIIDSQISDQLIDHVTVAWHSTAQLSLLLTVYYASLLSLPCERTPAYPDSC